MRCVVVVIAVAGNGFCGLIALLLVGFCPPAIAQGTNPPAPPALLTNLLQLRQSAGQRPFVLHPFRIEADVLDADAAEGVLVVRDSSGSEFIQLDLRGREIEPGTRVCLEGNGCGVMPKEFGLALVPGMVVDNDGLHGMRPVPGTTFLHAGINPIAVQWFNGLGGSGLNVEYAGPGLARQPIPGSVLSTAKINPATGVTNFPPGLAYRCYEGAWVRLPDFARHHPVTTGVATNFGLSFLTTNRGVGLEFTGYITIPQEGAYTFYLASDDGSRLFVGGSSLDVHVISGSAPLIRQQEMGEGRAAEKVPAAIPDGNRRPNDYHPLPPSDYPPPSIGLAGEGGEGGRGSNLMTLEGAVKFAGVRGADGELVMRVGNDEIRAGIFAGGETATNYPAGARVRVSGIYQDVISEDGSRGPGMLLVPSWKAVRPVSASGKRMATVISPGEASTTQAGETAAAAATPTIATAAEVKELTPEMARQELPVTVRGVVTAILPEYLHGAVIQDSTKGVFVALHDIPDPKPLQRGEFYLIEGVTGPGSFAPLVVARRITHLGAGVWPPPLHATWDELINGSLDTQYAEVDGVVTAIRNHQIEMLTQGGKISLELDDLQPEDLAGYENALIQIRGCAFAFFNLQTRELDASSLRILGGAIEVLEPAPQDLFDAPQKSMSELLLFDPQAAPFRRLKVRGQVVSGRAGVCYLTDGTNGMRVTTRNSGLFEVGDLVEAVGFLELGSPAVELKEAVLRKTGHAPPPVPILLTPDQLLLARHAGTLVRVDATLMNQWREGPEYVLELQSGFLAIRARMDGRGQSVRLPPPGSRLELAGVYAPLGNRARDGTVSGFELLLDSPADIRVLATPPWWTLKRMLVIAGFLAALLCAVLIWNKELQRKVKERSRQLELETHQRQHAELQRAAEAERSRIARDLHDELGAGLTEVSLLASIGPGESREAENQNDRFRAIAEKARALVSGLDVIVWAIDPGRNSLQSFADYLGHYAAEVSSASNIVCRFKIPIECEAVALTEAARHSLFLAVKEALNNVIRHASATEVKLQMTQAGDGLEIVIADNGRGFDVNAIRRGNGLTNLGERLKALHGRCRLESQIGAGTTVTFTLPLPRDGSDSQRPLKAREIA
jgi:signal transduction histidine kinase